MLIRRLGEQWIPAAHSGHTLIAVVNLRQTLIAVVQFGQTLTAAAHAEFVAATSFGPPRTFEFPGTTISGDITQGQVKLNSYATYNRLHSIGVCVVENEEIK